MRHGFHEARARTRRRGRILLGIAKWAVLLAIFGAIGYYAHETGTRIAQRDTIELRRQVAELTTATQTLQRDKDQLQRDLATTSARAEELRKRYESDVPTGAISEILRLAREKLSAGVTPERIAGVLAAVENARRCDDKPTSKRFLVKAGPRAPAVNDTVSFADRTITVSATGEITLDAEGRPQAWFDPGKPLTVVFTRIGGAETVAKGVLPINHSVVVNDLEHRFVVTQGDARGFVTVTSDSCKYP
ncbi:MAG: hypothetical protein JNK67_25025 [Alphaproteobacteria bacterium]|nr:hypothetical protein [Alphaproteobacteria bacterium]